MIGAEDELDRARDVEDLLGKQIVVIEGEEHAGERRSCRPRSPPRSSCSGTCRCRARAPPPRPRGSPARNSRCGCCSSAWQSTKASDRQREHDVVEHHRAGRAGCHRSLLRVLRDRQEQAGRAADPAEMIEADARELGEGDGQDGEIDAGDAEAEREEADDGAGERAAIGDRGRAARATGRCRNARRAPPPCRRRARHRARGRARAARQSPS